MWFTSFARPSLSPSPAARGGAAVREGPAGRQLLPAPAGGGLCDKAAGWRSFLSPSPQYVRGGSFVFLWGRAELVQPRPQCRFGAGQLLPLRDAAQPGGQHPSRCPAGRFACCPSPASSRWGAWKWGSLRQRQTKAQRRGLPPPPGLGSAAPGSSAHLPARPAGRRGCGGSGAGEARAAAVQSGDGGGMCACALHKQEVERPH